jgi:thioredoxin reductase (NADPH)
MAQVYEVIIVGGGIGGSAAALRAAQNNLNTLWLLGDRRTRKRSRSQWVYNLDNIVGFHEDVIKEQVLKTLQRRGATEAAELIEKEHYHIHNRGIIKNTIQRLKRAYPHVMIREEIALKLEKTDSNFRVTTPQGNFRAVAVVLATGVMDEQPQFALLNRSGERETSPRWIYPFANREQVLYCIRCEGHLTKEEAVAVLGHTNTAVELSFMLYERYGNRVYLLTDGQALNVDPKQRTLLAHYQIEVITEPVTELLQEDKTLLQGFGFTSHEPVYVKFALVALGLHRVYNDLARQVGARLMDPEQPVEKRHVWINHKGETSVKNLFAVGDMVKREDEPVMKQVYTAQEYAVRAVDVIDYRRRKALREAVLGQ